jgi:hypothetical protein
MLQVLQSPGKQWLPEFMTSSSDERRSAYTATSALRQATLELGGDGDLFGATAKGPGEVGMAYLATRAIGEHGPMTTRNLVHTVFIGHAGESLAEE